jgi:hypothetical protein
MIYRWLVTSLCTLLLLSPILAVADDGDFGQIIKIHTDLCSLYGSPSWLLIIRDLDHGVNLPYVYDFTQGQNFWLALAHSKNYLITVSQMHFYTYNVRENSYRQYTIKNFCGLQSFGRIIRGDSISIYMTGDLKPYPDTLVCNVSQYADPLALNAMRVNS